MGRSVHSRSISIAIADKYEAQTQGGCQAAGQPWQNPVILNTPIPMNLLFGHLDQLEAESIHIFREVAASFQRPVMLYSIGKDSSVLLHLLRKAFFPARPP